MAQSIREVFALIQYCYCPVCQRNYRIIASAENFDTRDKRGRVHWPIFLRIKTCAECRGVPMG